MDIRTKYVFQSFLFSVELQSTLQSRQHLEHRELKGFFNLRNNKVNLILCLVRIKRQTKNCRAELLCHRALSESRICSCKCTLLVHWLCVVRFGRGKEKDRRGIASTGNAEQRKGNAWLRRGDAWQANVSQGLRIGK